ncbi:MAG: hypothetical protein ABI690_11740 [Chloroflexota bacterium]
MRKLVTILLIVSIVVLIAAIPVFGVSAAGAVCAGAPTPRLTSGIQARPAQVYSTLWASPDSIAVLTVMYHGDTFNVQSGVICAFGPYNWYQVNFKGVVGWVTEGTGSTYWVEPTGGVSPTPVPGTPIPPTQPPATPATPTPNTGACAGAPAPRLKIGGNGRPTQDFSSLRSGIDSNTVIAVMYAARGDVFKVTAGPFCGYGLYNWWQVNFKGTLGYVTEGTGNTYWVEPAP